MSVFYLLIPLAIVAAAVALTAFVWMVRSGQADDLDTPPWRILFDESESKADIEERHRRELNGASPSQSDLQKKRT